MSTFFVDTSAVAKRYLAEIGSRWVRSWIEPTAGHIIIIFELTPVEMFSLLARKHRDKSLTSSDLLIAQTDFLRHVEQEYLSITLDGTVLVQSRALVSRYPLRALDAIQLAAAWRASTLLQIPLTFVSGDNKLLSAATAEGFSADNPYMHP